jgi:RND superfamily putative drug exporter
MYAFLGRFVARRWWLVILVWVAAAAGLNPAFQRKFLGFTEHTRFATPTWDEVTKDGDLAYLPDRMTSVRGQKLYGEAFPENKSRSEAVVIIERKGGLTQEDLDFAQQVGDYFEAEKAAMTAGEWTDPKTGEVLKKRPLNRLAVIEVMRPARNLVPSKRSAEDLVGAKLMSPDKEAVLVVCSLEHEFIAVDSAWVIGAVNAKVEALKKEAETRAEAPLPSGMTWGLSGSAAVGGDTLIESDKSVKNIHFATGILVLLILLAVYRAPILVFVPLITIGVSVVLAKDLTAALTQLNTVPGFSWFHFEIFKTSEIFIFVILFGSGTDFCLFLISRYKEEMERGLDKAKALEEALAQVGEALTGSALTVVCGLGMMFFADFGKFTYSGPSIALCLMIALLACITFAPAMLRGFGKLVFWPFGLRMHTTAQATEELLEEQQHSTIGRFWNWTSDHIMAYPGRILLVSLVVMTPFAIAGWHVKVSYDLLADLPMESTDRDGNPVKNSRQGTDMLRSHFPAGETGPITMLVVQEGAEFDTPEWRREITKLTTELYELSESDIKSVRSLTAPLGDKPQKTGILGSLGGKTLQNHKLTEAKYVAQQGPRAGHVTRFDVIQAYDPFSTDAERVLGTLEAFTQKLSSNPDSKWYKATFDFIGTTAGTRDLKAIITSDERLIQQLVVLGVFAVILSILRRPMICLYLIFTVVFSYFTTIGATELAFEWMYGEQFVGLDWKVPIFLFVILVAVGEDYNIYLATRVFEEERRLGREKGLREAIIRTGGIITSCGVIMAGTFVSLMTGTLKAMHALGFALTLGVILDTFIVRPVLVPAFLAWLYRMLPERKPAVGQQTEAVLEPTMASALVTDSVTIPAKPHAEMARRTVKG